VSSALIGGLARDNLKMFGTDPAKNAGEILDGFEF
jgi:hypothetical protein